MKQIAATDKQLEVLLLVYKFRFITAGQLAKLVKVHSLSGVRGRLDRMVGTELLCRRYDNSYRLQQRQAEYCIGKAGVRALRGHERCNTKVLHSMYRDRSATQSFISQKLLIVEAYLEIEKLPNVKILSSSQLQHHDYLPTPRPDLMVSFNGEYYFVDVLREADPFFVSLHKKAKRYVAYAESGEWEAKNKGIPLPNVITITDTEPLKKRIGKRIEKLGLASWEDVIYMTQSIDELRTAVQYGHLYVPDNG